MGFRWSYTGDYRVTLCCKLFAVVIIVGGIISSGAYWYYTDSQETIKRLTENNTKLEIAINGYENQKEIFQKSIKKMSQINIEMAQERDRLSKRVDKLSNKFAKHDIGMLANRKPTLVQRKINRAVKELNSEVEKITTIDTTD